MTDVVHSLDINVPKKAAYNATGTTANKKLFSSPQNRRASIHRSQKSHSSMDSSFRGDRSVGGIDSSLRGGMDRHISGSLALVPMEPTIPSLAVDPLLAGETKQTLRVTSADHVQEILGSLPILIVDDSVSILKMTKRAIQNECANISFMEAKNGEEALAWVVEAHANFELIITDIQMPICNGFDFTRRVRQLERDQGLNPKLIIGISANDQLKISIEAKESGMVCSYHDIS